MAKVRLFDVRIAFANGLFEAKAGDQPGSKPKFQSSFILPPNHPGVAVVRAAMLEVAKEKWGVKGQAMYDALVKADKVCIRDGSLKDYEGFSGNLYVSASNEMQPKVKDLSGQIDVKKSDGLVVSGVRVVAFLEVWAQDNKFGKRINASLRGVQFLKDDNTRFGSGGVARDEDFENLASPEEISELV